MGVAISSGRVENLRVHTQRGAGLSTWEAVGWQAIVILILHYVVM